MWEPKTALFVCGLLGSVVMLAGFGFMVAQAKRQTWTMNLKARWPGFALVVLGVIIFLVALIGLRYW